MENNISLQYLAGFIDGEGCFNVSKCRTNLVPRIIITNTNIEILELFKKQFGGDIGITRVKNKPLWKARGSWHISHSKAYRLTEQLLPYLIVKNPQARLFLEIEKMAPRARKMKSWSLEAKNLIKNTMNLLNKKGN